MEFNRRSFLIGAGSVAALSTQFARLARAASSESERLLFDADMEVASLTEYETYGDSTNMQFRVHGNSPIVSAERARAGTRSMKSHINRSTSATSYRTEFTAFNTTKTLAFRRSYWIGLSIYVPSDWKQSTSGDVLFQIHNQPDDWANSKSPIFAIVTQKGGLNWRLANFYITRPEAEVPGNTGLILAFANETQPIRTGEWTDWVIEYRPDWRLLEDGGVGVTRVWKDGLKIVDYAGPNAFNETLGPYLSFGLYKSAWRSSTFVDTVAERYYYHDELRVSRPDQGSYELVAPGRDAGTARPNSPTLTVT